MKTKSFFWKQCLQRFRTLFVVIFLFMGFSAETRADEMKDVELREGDRKISFSFPASFNAKLKKGGVFTIHGRYPDMTPLKQSDALHDDSVRIYLWLSIGGRWVENFLESSLPIADPKRPGSPYLSEEKGPYQLYRYPSTGKLASKITYVFSAQDGALVSVEEGMGKAYVAERKIGSDLHIRYIYLANKSIGSDFIKIDEVVVTFIKKHLKTK